MRADGRFSLDVASVTILRLNFAQPPLEKSPLAVVGDQRECLLVAARRGFRVDPMRRSRSARAACSK